MEEPGRPRSDKQGSRLRNTATDEADTWRSQESRHGYNPIPAGGQQNRKNQGGVPYRPSPNKGGMGPLSSSPGGFRGGHSPSQQQGVRSFPGPQNREVRGDGWRGHPKHPQQQQQQQPPQWRKGEHMRDERDYGNREPADSVHNSGGRRRNRDRRRGFGEEDQGPVIDESTLSAKELQLLQEAEELLVQDQISRLKKRARNNPNAMYTCSLCDVLLESLSAAQRHSQDKWHKKRAREKREQEMLTEIKPPGPAQVTEVGTALQAVFTAQGLTEEDVAKRQDIVSTMQALLLSVLPEIQLRLYGSSCTKFGFKDADINIDILYPLHMHQPEVLLRVRESLSASPLFVDLDADFHARVPVVICKEKQSRLVCKVSAGNDHACQTTSYLATLANQQPLVLPLVIAFRHWAQICQLDCADEGGLPAYVLALMVIYFLQQRTEPLLPTYLNFEIKEFSLGRLADFSLTRLEDGHVHWAYAPAGKDASLHAKGKVPLAFQKDLSSVAVGQLWVEMLRFYSLEFNMVDNVISVRTKAILSREAKDWPKKRMAVEDPFAVKRNVARSMNSPQMYEYFVHCLKTTYKYFALPLNSPSTNHKLEKPRGPPRGDKAPRPDPAAPLLKGVGARDAGTPPAPRDPLDSDCIIEQEEEVENDPEKEKMDLGKSSLSEEDDDDDDDDDDEEEEREQEEEDEDDVYGRLHLDSVTTEDDELFVLDEISGEELLSDEEGPDFDLPGSMDEEEEQAPPTLTPKVAKGGAGGERPETQKQKPVSQGYEFTRQAFTRGKSHMVVCSLCKRDGHLKKDCPEEFKKVELEPLPAMTAMFLKTLNQICEQCFKDFAPDKPEVSVREHILQDVENFIQKQFAGQVFHCPSARLQLFGSSKNGFGFRQSDLDICMVLDGQETADDLDCISIIESMARLLRKHPGLRNILPITTAKVPIVKFYHVRTGLEGDISLYNTLALHNTHLLACYAAIDWRVKILCYVMKVFAKMCDIGDASRGSLSSYAYTLLALFFLQQRNPPVIPVLQEIYDGEKKPELLVDGWNVYFFDDLKALPGRWPQHGKNVETVGQLWLGLLQFYTEVFDFREHVISIRQLAPLTTFNKQWTSKYIVIEDPFDLNHNLGSGLSRRMTNFIMKAFINGRKVFGTPVASYPPEYPSPMEYFFDPDVLTEGELAPNDRCCRICGKIGHFMKDCPMRKRSRQRRDMENWTDNPRDRQDLAETPKDSAGRQGERWKRPEEKRCCFLCGSHTHIKKDCSQYRGPTGKPKTEMSSYGSSPSSSTGYMRNYRDKDKQGGLFSEEKKRKPKSVILGPQSGSLANSHIGGSGHRRSPVE
ncbi:terminal uridylyltransferase 7 isoform X1 [Gadus chalcogrammus]|uniref:terminal uridylyltransferase 7 isoform X1 n=1 Tax=Gadus chalcogrammus TaxID=1042646 RepID=UPI0024C29CB6|nr:terminal uridylyltransferase 7 isoform X1 [Gadus chalcogrammus]